MAKHYISLDDLRSKLRLQGVESLQEVKKAYLEPDGDLSVIRYQPDEREPESGQKQKRVV
jgi:uncharacterized membrane protein YcaP (DUF421 family)